MMSELLSQEFSGQCMVGQPRAGLWFASIALCVAGLLLSAPAFGAVQSTQKKSTSHRSTKKSSALRSGRHAYGSKWVAAFPGSHDMLVEQNAELDRQQVGRMNTEYELVKSELDNDLVPVNETDALKISDNLTDNRRYCRPWTRDFLQDFSQAFFDVFHSPLQVNSLVRTANQQAYLRRHNRFAAPAFGDTASTHLAGVSVDLSRRGLSNTQYQWIKGYLQPLQEKGLVNPIEERQPVLHIVVFEKYSGPPEKGAGPASLSEASELTEADPRAYSGSQP